jgi:hypothetical protein
LYLILCRGYSDNFQLHKDDIKAIENLYGRRRRSEMMTSILPQKITTETPSINMIIKKQEYNHDNNNFFNLFGLPTLEQRKHYPTTKYQHDTNYDKFYNIFKIAVTTTPTTTTTTTTTTTITTQNLVTLLLPKNILCHDSDFDSISLLQDGFTYVFKQSYVYKFDMNFRLDAHFPKLIKRVFGRYSGGSWTTIPNRLDSVLYVEDTSQVFFFKNNFVWRSSQLYEIDAGFPRLISDQFHGLDRSNQFYGKLDATFQWSGNQQIYFIEKDKYWRYDSVRGSVEPGYPKPLAIWRGLSNQVTSAFVWLNGITYFFNNDKYYRFNDYSFKVDTASPSYPRRNSDIWFGCYSPNQFGSLIII